MTLVVVSAAAIALRRAGGRTVATIALPFAVVCAGGVPVAAVVLAGSGAFALALSLRPDDDATRARFLAASAVLMLLVGEGFASAISNSAAAIAVGTSAALAGLWALALLLDERRAGTGVVARVAAALPVYVAVVALGPVAMIGPLAVAIGLATIDALVGSRPLVLIVPALLVQLLVYDVAIAIGCPIAVIGLVLCAGVGVWAAVTALVPPSWRTGPATAAVLGFLIGLDLAATQPSALATAVMIGGALIFAGGLFRHDSAIAHGGAAVATLGLFGHFALAGVDAVEWYLTPIGAQLLVAGWQLRRRDRVSSWVAVRAADRLPRWRRARRAHLGRAGCARALLRGLGRRRRRRRRLAPALGPARRRHRPARRGERARVALVARRHRDLDVVRGRWCRARRRGRRARADGSGSGRGGPPARRGVGRALRLSPSRERGVTAG